MDDIIKNKDKIYKQMFIEILPQFYKQQFLWGINNFPPWIHALMPPNEDINIFMYSDLQGPIINMQQKQLCNAIYAYIIVCLFSFKYSFF